MLIAVRDAEETNAPLAVLPLAQVAHEAYPPPGSGESGKSTIVKQMKIIHQNGYNHDELMKFRTTIYKNLLESAHHILLAARKIGLDFKNPTNRVCSGLPWPCRAAPDGICALGERRSDHGL